MSRVSHEAALAGFYKAQEHAVKSLPLYDQCIAIYDAMRAVEIASPHPTSADKLEVVAWRGRIGSLPWELALKDPTPYAVLDAVEPLVRHSDATRIITEQAERIAELEIKCGALRKGADEFFARLNAAKADRDRMKEALTGLLDHIDRNTCVHESVSRGGAIWTICDDCGKKWADDRGGFAPYSDPEPVSRARSVLNGGAEK